MGKIKGLVTDHGYEGAQAILNKLKHEKNGIGKRYSIQEIKTAVDIAVGDDGRRSAEVIEILLDAENEDE